MSERVCTHGHVLDADKDVCSRCGGAESVPATAPEAVEESVDNAPESENVPENGSTEPENVADESVVNEDTQTPSEDAPKVNDPVSEPVVE